MRELRLRYFIDLVSNIEAKARSHGHALATAQGKIQAELGKTNVQLTAYERLLLRAAGLSGAGIQRQAQYFASIAQNAHRAEQAVQKYVNIARKAGGLTMNAARGAGAVAAGAYVAKSALDKPIDYDTRLRAATSTAFAGGSNQDLEVGFTKLGGLIDATVRQISGASRDSTLGAYEKLIGSGTFSKDESAQLLPAIMKTAVASRSDANDLVMAAEKMKVSLKLTAEEIPIALAKVMRAGQEGGFEIKDSARWLGPLLPYMKGYQGMAGVEHLVTMLQQSRATAGTNDEAANNLRNFVQKIGADSTAKDFKKQGIDLPAEMAKGAVRGELPVAVYMAQIDRVMQKQDPQGKARAAMQAIDSDKSLNPEERKARYDRVAEIYETSGVSKIIADLQEFGGYSALRGTKDYGQKVLGAVQSEQGNAVATGYDFMTAGTGAKATDVANRKDIAMSDLLNSQSGALNAGLDKVVKLTDEFPKTTAAAAGAALALTALAAASGVAALVGGRGGAAAAAGAAAKPGWLASAAGKVSTLVGAGAARLGFAGGASASGALGGAASGVGSAAGTTLRAVSKVALPLGAAMGAYDLGRLGLATADLASVKMRGGVQLTPEAQARVAAMNAQTPAPARQMGDKAALPAVPTLPLPLAAPAPLPSPAPVTQRSLPPSVVRLPVPAAAPLAPTLPGIAPIALAAPPVAPPAPAPAPIKPLPANFARDAMLRAMPAPAAMPASAAAQAAPKLDYLSLSSPKQMGQKLALGSSTEIKLGEGKIDVRVTLDDQRAQVAAQVVQQPSLVRLSAGATNPGSFR